MKTEHTFTDYLETAFFAYMHDNAICPRTHEGIKFYFGKIYERCFDKSDCSYRFDIREDLFFLIEDAKKMQANEVKLGFTHGVPYVAS